MSKRPPITRVAAPYRKMVRKAMDSGWTMTQSRTGHPVLTSPDGNYSTPIPGSSKDRGSLVQAVRLRLRRHGVDV
jgi:hypothetical protein